jgi:hypothetical protein
MCWQNNEILLRETFVRQSAGLLFAWLVSCPEVHNIIVVILSETKDLLFKDLHFTLLPEFCNELQRHLTS